MKKILLIDDSDTYTWCLQKYLQHRGYPVKTAGTLKEARAADKKLPFILASCHNKEDYEQEAKRWGATLCMDKMKGLLLQDKAGGIRLPAAIRRKGPDFSQAALCPCGRYQRRSAEGGYAAKGF